MQLFKRRNQFFLVRQSCQKTQKQTALVNFNYTQLSMNPARFPPKWRKHNEAQKGNYHIILKMLPDNIPSSKQPVQPFKYPYATCLADKRND
ncbi:MAG: hypothetical protein CVU06_00480 [Bacteroidetes bacterium HGW-Bacteroidetes-22]|nr:MAG: hypothetical protein CVU06_00480 [Bacteroidetes bacterium HGW-Bacteroidetes-22]